MRKIGIYAGTFDPVHVGHVAFARRALEACGLDEVVFFPERNPWRKTSVADIGHRLALLEYAIADEPGLRAIDLEVKQFTARLALPELDRLFSDSELVLMMGSDVARFLHTWDDVGELLAALSLAVALRGDDTSSHVDEVMTRLMQAHGPVAYQIVEVPHTGVSSTAVRRGDHAAVHPEVSAHIKRHGLYSFRA